MSNPYAAKPTTSFWRRAVAGTAPFDLDPMIAAPFRITPTDKVATAGSCFAQHIARGLQSRGLEYYVSETAPSGMPDGEGAACNYGTFSARFGNIYTVRQLVQLFDRAFGGYEPSLSIWHGRCGEFIDPFRPQIQPGGFSTAKELLDDRVKHLNHVRRMFKDLTVFVFTLGLTESWIHEADDAVVPLAPGVADQEASLSDFSFVNFTVSEVAADLQAFHDRLRRVNPAARMILTVSPVPLIATFENRHVLVSTTYSKSVLHVAALEASVTLPDVSYFPSYEIITSPNNRDRYFEDDLRNVRPEGVRHVMRVFFRHYLENKPVAVTANLCFKRETDTMKRIVCDEEMIDL